MGASREDVLANIRRSLGVTGGEAPRRASVDQRLAARSPGVVPARGDVQGAERLALFVRQAENVQCTIEVVASADGVPAAVATYLRDRNLPASARMGADPRLAAMPWQETSLNISSGPSDGADLNAVSFAFAGVAETGTLVLLSGQDNPTTLNFLPDQHIVVLDSRDLAGNYETVWTRLREHFSDQHMPRTVNWISGPSRSGDIERTLLLGAHGPRSVHVIVIDR